MSSHRSRSRSSSMFCDAITSNGVNCRNYHMKGDKFCYTHKMKQSKLIVHTSPVVQFQEIVFNDNQPAEETCTFKNKYGERICSHTKAFHSKRFCQEHCYIIEPYVRTISKMLELVSFYKENNFTLDSFFKLVGHMAAYFLKHKHLVVAFSLGDMLNNMLTYMINENITSLMTGNFMSNLVYHNGSKPFGFYINMLFKLRKQLLQIREHVQIETARDTLVSNNIKMNKLTEIHLKKQETSTEILPVFSKGIDKHILKFIV
ncbi:MAG: hypothetical protein EBY29_17250 [Planctomycetes bacterium]|nr:hypothetical protein [Planctomycetota bacterium]